MKLCVSSVSVLAALVVHDFCVASESESLENVQVDESIERSVEAEEVVVVQRDGLELGVDVESISV